MKTSAFYILLLFSLSCVAQPIQKNAITTNQPVAMTNVIAAISATNVFNVKAFGAVADGVTADNQAIWNTVHAAMTNGGVVYLPPGEYALDHNTDPLFSDMGIWGDTDSLPGIITIPSNNIVFMGAGQGATKIKVTDWVSNRNLMNINYATNVTVSGITWNAQTNSYNGIKMQNIAKVTIQNCDINNVRTDALESNTGYKISVLNCTFFDNPGNAIGMAGTGDGEVRGCYVNYGSYYTNYAVGLQNKGEQAAFQMRQTTCLIADSQVYNNPVWLQQAASTLNVNNCAFYSATNSVTNTWALSGIMSMNNCYLGGHSSALQMMVWTNAIVYLVNNIFGSGMNVYFDNAAEGSLIGNQFNAVGTHTLRFNAARRLKVIGNRIVNNGSSGIRMDGSTGPSTNCIFQGNTLSGGGFHLENAYKNLIDGNQFDVSGVNGMLVSTSGTNLICNNIFASSANLQLNATGTNYFKNNIFGGITFGVTASHVFEGNVLTQLPTGANGIAASRWLRNTGPSGFQYWDASFVVTSNLWTNTSIKWNEGDSVYTSSNGVPHVIWLTGGVYKTNRLVP